MTSHNKNAANLASLRARIAVLEGFGGGERRAGLGDHSPGDGPGPAPVVSLGGPEIDRALPWGGLVRGALHEILEEPGSAGAADGFAAFLLARLATAAPSSPVLSRPVASRPVLWVCAARGSYAPPYAPGLRAFGLDPARVLVARARRDADLLWAIEEATRTPALAAVLGEVRAADFTASRRLQLAAAASGVTVLLRRSVAVARDGTDMLPASAAASRWLVTPAPSGCGPRGDAPRGDEPAAGCLGAPRWRVALLRCRGGRPHNWLMEWNDATSNLSVVAPAGDRPDRQNAA